MEHPLEKSETVFKIMTSSVLDSNKDILEINEVGEAMYTEFLEKRKTDEEISVWVYHEKRNFSKFQRC